MAFEHLDIALLYEPGTRVATIQYVHYRSVKRKTTGYQSRIFNLITGNLEGFFTQYYTSLLGTLLGEKCTNISLFEYKNYRQYYFPWFHVCGAFTQAYHILQEM